MYHVIPENVQGQFEHADKLSRKDKAIQLAKKLARELDGITCIYVFPGDDEQADFSKDYVFKADAESGI